MIVKLLTANNFRCTHCGWMMWPQHMVMIGGKPYCIAGQKCRVRAKSKEKKDKYGDQRDGWPGSLMTFG